MEPERRDRRAGENPAPQGDPRESRRRIVRAALLKPLNLITLFIGLVFFAITLSWWVLPLTLGTYALLVVLATRDPLFERRVLGTGEAPQTLDAPETSNVPLERRARWLPRGETRRTVEEALVAYRKLVASIEGAGETARAVLEDAVPKLHSAAERLVNVAHDREEAAEALREIKGSQPGATPDGERSAVISDLENKIRKADEEISGTYDRLLVLRTRVVGLSLNSAGENRAAASELNRSLDELNFRLEALGELASDPGNTPPRGGES